MSLATYSPLRRLYYEHSFFVYSVLTVLLIVSALYWGSKDWKGFGTTDEVDLGEMNGPHHRRRKHSNTTRRRHYDYY